MYVKATGSVGFPLKSFEVELEVRDHVATVVSTLNYENKEDKPLEAVFVFPLPGDAAVCHFSAQIGQTQIVAELKEKQKARQEYDDALSSGQQAFLLEESDESPDIFSLHVGSLPPGESASIRLEYVTELAVQADDGLRFCLPAVLNPPYQPQDRTTITFVDTDFQSSSCSEGAGVQVTSVPASLVPYSLSFSARVSSPRPVSKVESNCSLDPLQYLNTDQTQATVKLAAGHKFDRDVELLIYYKDAHQPTAVVETMAEALKKVEKMKADLGGTKILEPLKHIYSQPCIPNQPRQLLCFSFGIGEGASCALINGMAKEGGGHAQFITGTDRMQPKVMQSLRFALQLTVIDTSVTWDLPKEVSVTVSPPITTLFQGQRSLIYAQLTGQSSEAAEGCVTLKYTLAGHRSENQLRFSLRPAEDSG
ncbi:von Willebrand factor A domain-containing protein 5A-like [Oreochromis aureus]|uniref:von Willebrand factor A domain-containing protein 5A-like n=1 Tax=Oreochromis aureus TaxID=47969 RepID=UPI001954E814|nr:von Willebrand factor A domain-containing protein 5A-like [Oreochromis aureus]